MGTGTTAYWVGKVAADKHRAKEEAKRAKRKAKNLPKVFDYYCPHCLFQTNEYKKICPQCRNRRLEKTTNEKARNRFKKD
jgi:lipopolysaccharide biosynthesis regulator YciM